MNHAELDDEAYDLYVMGLLDDHQNELIAAHLREHCEYCWTKVGEAERLSAAMVGMADQVRPPARLRRRLLASVGPPKRSFVWVYAVAGLAAACLALLAFTIWTGDQSGKLRDQLAAMRAERNELRSALELMSRPETHAVQFGNIQNAPRGRVFVSRTGGVVFVGNGLPDLPENKSFELWLVPPKGAPQPAGVFRPDNKGNVVNVAAPTNASTEIAAVAVSIEPLAGSNAPTTKPFLVVPVT